MICIDYLLFIFEIKVIEIGDWMILAQQSLFEKNF